MTSAGAPPEFEETVCGACGGARARPSVQKRGFQYRQCADCGHVYVSPRWTPATALAYIYAPAAYHTGTSDLGGKDKTDTSRANADAREHLRRIRRVTGLSTGALFEVGCSTGRFLEVARDAGFRVAGCDLSDWAAREARERGLSVSTGELGDAHLPEATVDLVTMWEVLEHLYAPRKEIAEVSRVLRPGGWFVFFTLNQASSTARRATRRLQQNGEDPFHWYRPEQHIQHFTPSSATRLLRDRGFDRVVIELASSAAGLERAAARIGVSGARATAVKRVVRRYLGAPKRILTSLLAYVRQGEILYGFAQKPDNRTRSDR